MTIEYMFGELISQNTLATEMHTDPIKGETDPTMMGDPFSGRGHSSTESRGMTLDELKKQNSDGSILIILIWFDTNHKYGHYVVVTGYDESGIFVNDPWPSNWGQPKGRTTGKNAFIPYALLADLWTYSNKWALIVPTPAHALIPTAILVLGVLAVCFLGGFAYLMLKRARLREPYVQRAFSEAMDYLS